MPDWLLAVMALKELVYKTVNIISSIARGYSPVKQASAMTNT